MKLLIETKSQTNESRYGGQISKQIDREDLRKMYRLVFSSPEGKEVLQDLANISGVFKSNFALGRSDYTNFLEGHRALFFYICSHLEDEVNNIKGDF